MINAVSAGVLLCKALYNEDSGAMDWSWTFVQFDSQYTRNETRREMEAEAELLRQAVNTPVPDAMDADL